MGSPLLPGFLQPRILWLGGDKRSRQFWSGGKGRPIPLPATAIDVWKDKAAFRIPAQAFPSRQASARPAAIQLSALAWYAPGSCRAYRSAVALATQTGWR